MPRGLKQDDLAGAEQLRQGRLLQGLLRSYHRSHTLVPRHLDLDAAPHGLARTLAADGRYIRTDMKPACRRVLDLRRSLSMVVSQSGLPEVQAVEATSRRFFGGRCLVVFELRRVSLPLNLPDHITRRFCICALAWLGLAWHFGRCLAVGIAVQKVAATVALAVSIWNFPKQIYWCIVSCVRVPAMLQGPIHRLAHLRQAQMSHLVRRPATKFMVA